MFDIGLVSLILLVLVIFLGFLRRLNVGVLAIAAAAILGSVSGQFTSKEVISGFSASLFMTLLGVTLFFGIVQENGCLELIMKRLVGLTGKQIWAIPILVYAVGFVVAAIGPGCVPAMAFAAAIAVPLAHESGYHPLMLLIMGNLGTYAGRFSPITPEGVLISSLLEEQGIVISPVKLLLGPFVGTIVLFVAVFLGYKGFAVKASAHTEAKQEVEKLQGNQWVVLASIVVMILLVIVGGIDVGLASFIVSVVLLLLGFAGEKRAFDRVPWSTLLLVCGVGVLMNLVISTGGIDMLANSMSSIMSPWSASGIIGVVSAVMSWFSSAIGVVWPTLIPTIGRIAENVGGNVHIGGLVSAVALFASVAGLSPVSTGGAIIMGACGADPEFSKQYPSEKNFYQLLLWAFLTITILAVMAFVGVFNWLA